MALVKSDSLLLRKIHYSNSSYILDVFTKEAGRITLIAKGARKDKSAFWGKLDYLSLLEMVFVDKADGMGILTECTIKNYFPCVHASTLRLCAGMLYLRMLREFLEEKWKEENLYTLSVTFIKQLEAFEENSVIPLYLCNILHLFDLTGYRPDFYACHDCGKRAITSVFFDFERYGILCHSCIKGKKTKKNLELSLNSVNIIQTFQNSGIETAIQVPYAFSDLKTVEKFELTFSSTVLKRDLSFLKMENFDEM